jgi:hypothetical protein
VYRGDVRRNPERVHHRTAIASVFGLLIRHPAAIASVEPRVTRNHTHGENQWVKNLLRPVAQLVAPVGSRVEPVISCQ